MIDHPARAHLAEIMVDRPGTDTKRGSGYLVAPGWVLTACHVVRGAASIGVWLGAPEELRDTEGIGVDTKSVLMLPGADLALLPTARSRSGPTAGERTLLGRLDRSSSSPVPVVAVGFPRHKLRPAPGRPEVTLREVHYATGTIVGGSNAKTSTHELMVQAVPGEDPFEPNEHSPWEGFSGAAVWSGQHVIGVVGQHHTAEPALTVRPIEELFSHASKDQLSDWRAALPQLPASAADLGAASPRTLRNIEMRRARLAVKSLAPPVLVGRSAELTALDEFARSDAQWRWIKGDAFAGKTALLAWFTLRPPDCVDIVACFLRRTMGENDIEYALDVLTRQLALLADWHPYQPPPNPSDRRNDFVELLEQASELCRRRDRRLLVLIDGLDEYDTTSADLISWLPNAVTLPHEAHLLVASRSRVDIHLPPTHPLSKNIQSIAASEAAIEIQDAARYELDHAFRQDSKTPGGFVYASACFLAAADSGLTIDELTALLKKRGRDADVGEIKYGLGNSLRRRSLVHLPEPDNGTEEVYIFAHDTLLSEARLRCAPDLVKYEDMLDEWASEYAERGFPIDTPRYLLRPYAHDLSRRARDPETADARCHRLVNQLFKVVAHRARLPRLFERTGSPAVPGQEIGAAQETILQTRHRSGLDPDEILFRLAVLAIRRRPLTVFKTRSAANIAVVWARIGRINGSLDLAISIENPAKRARALHEVALVLAVDERAGQARQAAADIENPAKRARALHEVARALATAGLLDEAVLAAGQARQAADDIEDPEGRARALREVARALVTADQVDQAALTMEQARQATAEIEDEERRMGALSKVALTLATAGQGDQAAVTAEQARQAAAQFENRERRTKVVRDVALALATAGRCRQALQAAADIEDLMSRAHALNEVAAVLAKAGWIGHAASATGQARQAATEIDNPEWRARTLIEVAEVLAKAGWVGQAASTTGQARQAAAHISAPEKRARALSEAAEVLARAGWVGQAASTAKQAWEAAAGIESRAKRADSLSTVGGVLVTAGLGDAAALAAGQARQAAAEVKSRDWRARALNEVVRALVTAGLEDEAVLAAEQARQVAADIESPAKRAGALSMLAGILATAGWPGLAVSAADSALQAAVIADESEWRARALNNVARVLRTAGRVDQAASAVDQARQSASGIGDLVSRARALNEVAWFLATAGRGDQAAFAAEEARQAASAIEGAERRARALSVARTLVTAGLENEAVLAAEQARQAASDIEDRTQRAVALTAVALALATADRRHQAVMAAMQAQQAARDIGSRGKRNAVMCKVAVALAAAGQVDEARKVASDITSRVERAVTLCEVALTLAAAGRVHRAASAAERARQVAADVEDPQRRARTLREVARALAAAGLVDTARSVAEQAQQATIGIEDPERRAGALSKVARALATAGLVDTARSAAEQAQQATASVEDPERRARALCEVARALATAGLVDTAHLAAEQARHATTQIDDSTLTTLLAVPLESNGIGDQDRRTFEVFLLKSNASEYLHKFPWRLLERLILEEQL